MRAPADTYTGASGSGGCANGSGGCGDDDVGTGVKIRIDISITVGGGDSGCLGGSDASEVCSEKTGDLKGWSSLR